MLVSGIISLSYELVIHQAYYMTSELFGGHHSTHDFSIMNTQVPHRQKPRPNVESMYLVVQIMNLPLL